MVRGCRRRWCPAYADESGFCPDHQQAPFHSSVPMPPGWPAIRRDQLAAHPWCGQCGIAVATEVHHIHGREAGHGPDNLRSLCGPCHHQTTGREAGSAWP